MRVGISLTSSYPGAEFRAGAAMMVERARAAWDAELDSLFVGDHHAMSQPYYQNVPMLGRLLAEEPRPLITWLTYDWSLNQAPGAATGGK